MVSGYGDALGRGSPDKKEVWGRPVGLLQLPDGSMLMTDRGGKKIWRISYKSAQTSAGQR